MTDSGVAGMATVSPRGRVADVVADAGVPGTDLTDLTVCIVTHNSADVVGDCLAAVPGAGGRLVMEVVVVDNASTDDTVAVVRSACPTATVILNDTNEGFSRANNRAIDGATGRFVLLLNPDTRPEPGSLEQLVAYARAHPDVGVVAPALLNPDGTSQGTARSFPTPAAALFGRRSVLTRWFPHNRWSRSYLQPVPEPDRALPHEVDWVSGACLMVPAAAIAAVGPLDPGYFMYWEDADWCRRIRASGRRVVTVPDARVVHHEGAARAGWPLQRTIRFHRSALRYYRRHHLRGAALALLPVAALLLALRATAVLLLSARPGRGAGVTRLSATATSRPLDEPTTRGDRGETAAIARSTGSQLVAKVVHLVLNVVSSLAVIRYLAPEGFGRYVLVMTVVTVLGLVANFGLDKLAVRETVRRPEAEDHIVGTAVTARLVLAVIAAALVQVALTAFGASAEVHVAGAVASLLFVGEALLTVVTTFHVRVQQHWEALARVAGEVVETALVLWLVTHGATLVQLVAAPVVGTGIAAVAVLTVARRRYGRRPRFDRALVAPLLRGSLSVGPALLIGVLFLRVDSLMVALLRPRSDVGIYGAAFQPIEYLMLASAVLVNVLFPVLTRHHLHNRERFTTILTHGSQAILAAMLAVPVVVTLIADDLVRFAYGAGFADSAVPLTILSWALVPLVGSVWLSFVLLATGHERETLRLNAAAVVVAVVLNLVAIPVLGVGGAALATLATATLALVATARVLAARTQALPDPRPMSRVVVAAAATFGTGAAGSWLGLAWPLAGAAALLAYPVLLVAFGAVPIRGVAASLRGNPT